MECRRYADTNRKLTLKKWQKLHAEVLKRTDKTVAEICEKYRVSTARYYVMRPRLIEGQEKAPALNCTGLETSVEAEACAATHKDILAQAPASVEPNVSAKPNGGAH